MRWRKKIRGHSFLCVCWETGIHISHNTECQTSSCTHTHISLFLCSLVTLNPLRFSFFFFLLLSFIEWGCSPCAQAHLQFSKISSSNFLRLWWLFLSLMVFPIFRRNQQTPFFFLFSRCWTSPPLSLYTSYPSGTILKESDQPDKKKKKKEIEGHERKTLENRGALFVGCSGATKKKKKLLIT